MFIVLLTASKLAQSTRLCALWGIAEPSRTFDVPGAFVIICQAQTHGISGFALSVSRIDSRNASSRSSFTL